MIWRKKSSSLNMSLVTWINNRQANIQKCGKHDMEFTLQVIAIEERLGIDANCDYLRIEHIWWQITVFIRLIETLKGL